MKNKLLQAEYVCEHILKIKLTTLEDWIKNGFVPSKDPNASVIISVGQDLYFRPHFLFKWIDDEELLTVKEVLSYFPELTNNENPLEIKRLQKAKDKTFRTRITRQNFPKDLIWKPKHINNPEIIKNKVRIKKNKFERWLYGDVSEATG